MTPKDVFRQVLESGDMHLRAYTADMTDADLLVRSVPGSNHAAWQLGHMVVGTSHMLTALGRPPIELPEGFAAAHSAENSASDDAGRFAKKAEYLALLDKAKSAIRQRAASISCRTVASSISTERSSRSSITCR